MYNRVTIKDISKKLGVSTTTVTKALNGKPKVSDEVRRQIIGVAEEMGYKPNKTAKALSRNIINIGMIFPEQPVEFYSYISKGLEKGVNDLLDYKVKGNFRPVRDLNSVTDMKNALKDLLGSKVDGIIFSPGFDHFEYKELIRQIDSKGIPVLYLVNDVSGSEGIGCVRMNGNIAGKMAAQFLSFCMGSEKNVVILPCNKEILIQRECIDGFIEETKRRGLNIKGVYETQDDKNVAYYLTEKLIKEMPDLKGIYVSSYNSVAVCKCIEDHHKTDEIFVIGQDLYPELVEKLENGSLKATLYQDPFEQGKRAVEIMYRQLTDDKLSAAENLITPQLVMTSNVESYRKYLLD